MADINPDILQIELDALRVKLKGMERQNRERNIVLARILEIEQLIIGNGE